MSEQGTEGETGSLNSGPLKVFTGLLGEDVFFVPCEWGTKKPLLTYVERPFEGTKSEAYQAVFNLEPTNIAVYLGKASGGLYAIDFDADEDLAAFLELNPALTATTRSRGSRGGMVWLRIEGGKKSDTSPQPSPLGLTIAHIFFMPCRYFVIVHQHVMYYMAGCLMQMHPHFVLRQRRSPIGPSTNSATPNSAMIVGPIACS